MDVPGVGKNLHDHIAAYGLTWTTQSAGLAYNPFVYTLDPRTYLNWKIYRVSNQFQIFITCIEDKVNLTLASWTVFSVYQVW